MKQERRRFEAVEKVRIIREHLLEKRPLGELKVPGTFFLIPSRVSGRIEPSLLI